MSNCDLLEERPAKDKEQIMSEKRDNNNNNNNNNKTFIPP